MSSLSKPQNHVLAAPDKFRGSQTARDVAGAITAGAARVGWTCTELPLADGGEGTLDAFGGANRTSTVTGPLGGQISAPWRLKDELAVIEAACASGLLLAGGREKNDPIRATTSGTGELISEALAAGAKRIVVGVGGSASTDGGLGCVEALRWVPFRSQGVTVEVAYDVRTLYLDAARVFAPQKGATAEQVVVLTQRLRAVANRYRRELDADIVALEGSGAAGGLAGGLAALGAELVAGFDLVADSVALDRSLSGVAVVITGEGHFDDTSLNGKVVGGVADRAARLGLRTFAIVGDGEACDDNRVVVVSLVQRFGRDKAFGDTLTCIADATEEILATDTRKCATGRRR